MNAKWYFGALLVILSLFGVSQDGLMVPNQEIVLQFSSASVSSNETELAIANVKYQLKTIGVSQVEVSKEANGRLVISYYSNATVASVKNILATDIASIDFASNKNNPSKKPTQQSYNFDVFEITKSRDTGFGSTGKLLLELKKDYDRFFNPNINVYAAEVNLTQNTIAIAVAFKQNTTIAIAINNIPYKIPEGRAGPLS